MTISKNTLWLKYFSN